MIQAENHRPSPRAYGRDRREVRRGPAGAPQSEADRPAERRRVTRRGWAVLAAVVIAAVLWGILIVAVAYIASHYSVAQLR